MAFQYTPVSVWLLTILQQASLYFMKTKAAKAFYYRVLLAQETVICPTQVTYLFKLCVAFPWRNVGRVQLGA